MRLYLLPMLVIAMLNSIPVQLCKRRFGEALPITLFCIPIVMYVSQYLFHTFNVALVAIVASSIAGMAVLVLRRRDVQGYCSNGLIAYAVVCLIILIIDFHRTFSDFDEFWHWGPMIKEMLRLDQFYCVDASRMIIHKDYPPFPALLELFWTRIGGTYNEGAVSAALHISFSALIIAPLSEKGIVSKESKPRAALWAASMCIVLLVIVGIFDYAHITFTILADIPLALFFAYALFCILSGGAYDSLPEQVSVVLAGVMIIMTKQAGMAMLATIVGLYLVIGLVEKRPIPQLVATTALIALIPLAFYVSWSALVQSIGVTDIRSLDDGTGQFTLSKIDFVTYVQAATKSLPGLQQDTFWEFIRALFGRNISSVPWITITYATSAAIIILLLLVIHKRFGELFNRQKALWTAVVFLAGLACYAFVLSVLFLFCFTPDEMQELRGYERYVGSFILGLVLSLVMVLIAAASVEGKLFERTGTCLAIALGAMVLYGTNMSYMAPHLIQEEAAGNYKHIAEEIIDTTDPETATLLVYDANQYGWYGVVQSYVYYYANDRDIPWETNLFGLDYTNEEGQQQAQNQLRNVDYLYILQTNDAMNEYLSSFNGGAPLEEGATYKVSTQGGALTLEKVEP